MCNVFIDDDIIKGKPTHIESVLKVEIANQILEMGGNNYEDVCDNVRTFADVIELLEEHINDDYIVLKYNAMGAWYVDENEEEKRVCNECGKKMTEGYCIENGLEYYCSDKCLHKHYTGAEYKKLYDNGNGNSYWTEWGCE